MLYYKNGRFRMDSVSYELPEGVYIDTEFQSVIATGFEIVDPEGCFGFISKVNTGMRIHTNSSKRLSFLLDMSDWVRSSL